MAKDSKIEFDFHFNTGDVGITRKMRSNTVIVQSREKFMRGLDYRSVNSLGIDLYLENTFNSTRCLIQGLNRVGRYNEPYGLYKMKNLNLFSNKKQTDRLGILRE